MAIDDQVRAQFEKLYDTYANDVLRVAYFYLGEQQRAEDVCQDVFIRYLTRAPQIREGHEKAWLLKVALNICRDIWRTVWFKRVVLGAPLEGLKPVNNIDDSLEKTALLEAVQSLSPAFKDVIILHYYQGYGIAEISKMTGVPEGTISSRLSRARKKLATILAGRN